jgi:hypothetical protein
MQRNARPEWREKPILNQFDSETGFFLGSLTTALAGAGAIVTPATAARVLAGTAGITSGINAEMTAKFFFQKTIQVLTNAFHVRRKKIYREIADRQNKGINEYPVEAAVKDALEYHGACSLIAGLEEAALSVERAQNPGLEELENVVDKVDKIRKKVEAWNPKKEEKGAKNGEGKVKKDGKKGDEQAKKEEMGGEAKAKKQETKMKGL